MSPRDWTFLRIGMLLGTLAGVLLALACVLVMGYYTRRMQKAVAALTESNRLMQEANKRVDAEADQLQGAAERLSRQLDKAFGEHPADEAPGEPPAPTKPRVH